MERSNVPNDKKQPSSGAAAKTTAAMPAKSGSVPAKPDEPTVPPVKPPRLFRPIDWAALLITFVFVFVAYYLTIAPEMTLEDSGELATGSFYAGIPHPPGYPVWTIFTYFWTLIPIGNVAWRVALAGCFAGALSSGLLAMIVSRGSSMMIESIDDLKNFDRRWENAICLVSGFVSGLLIGFNGYMWSQAVIVEVYPLSVVSLMAVLLCLLRWVYAPFQHRYLYAAFFFYGICVNNHQSLLVIAMGVEALIVFADRKVGREMLMWNSLIFLLGVIFKPETLWGNVPVRIIYFIIGITSIVGWIWLAIVTKKKLVELARDGMMLLTFGSVLAIPAGITHYVPKLGSAGAQAFLWVLAIASISGFAYLIRETKAIGKDWLYTLICGGAWLFGMAFYLFMPISVATVPPMEWGYPRTLEGFIHAFTRGQYEKIHPTSGTGNTPFEIVNSFFHTYLTQIWRYMEGLNDEFNILYLLLALVVFLFYLKMKRRERAWIIGMVATFICLGPFLVLLLNFPSDRQSLELNRVFLTSSHVIISMFVGFGLTLLATYLATHYSSARRIFMVIGLCIVDMAVFMLIIQAQDRFDLEKADWGMALGYFKVLCWLLAAASAIIFWREGLKEDKLLSYGVPTLFGAFSIIPTILALTSLEKPIRLVGVRATLEGIGDAFKPAHYGLPVLAALLLLTLGLIFVAALWAYRSRAPLAITLAVFAIMPSYSIFNHWFENEQRDHWFGYWFGHDMFTPPVEGPDGKFTYDPKVRAQMLEDKNKKDLTYPEMTRNAILFGGTDPGRFAPTYMIFCDSFIPHKCQPIFDQNFDRRDVYIITQNALADPTYLQYIRSQYFRSAETNYDTPFFQEVLRGKEEKDKYSQYYGTNILARWAYNLLDKPIADMGSRVETRRRNECVYPPKEIYTPSPDDSTRAFQEYMEDAQQRIIHDQMHPNEPKQVKPGEDVRVDGSGRVQVQGQVAVMAINGLLTKKIFDKNPTNEFFIEESFPLDWMFPNLTPFGVIMKINREPVPVITEDIVKRDHEFWAKYSERLIGNWITYDTPVTNITAFVEKVYMHHDYTGFTGDLKFIRDDQGQKAFSKLRSSIAGVYSWRLGQPPSGGITPSQYIAAGTNRAMLEREAAFAYKQAFAFCPYSPEAVWRYVQLLVNLHHVDDALAVVETAQRLDPYNPSFGGLIDNIRRIQGAEMPPAQIDAEIAKLEKEIKPGSTDFIKQFELAQKLMQFGRTERTFQVLDSVLTNPKAGVDSVMTVAKAYNDLGQPQKLQNALEALTRLQPEAPEVWYDLAASHATLNQDPAALDCLKKALQLNSQRLATDPKAADMRQTLAADGRFSRLRDTPEFKALALK